MDAKVEVNDHELCAVIQYGTFLTLAYYLMGAIDEGTGDKYGLQALREIHPLLTGEDATRAARILGV